MELRSHVPTLNLISHTSFINHSFPLCFLLWELLRFTILALITAAASGGGELDRCSWRRSASCIRRRRGWVFFCLFFFSRYSGGCSDGSVNRRCAAITHDERSNLGMELKGKGGSWGGNWGGWFRVRVRVRVRARAWCLFGDSSLWEGLGLWNWGWILNNAY